MGWFNRDRWPQIQWLGATPSLISFHDQEPQRCHTRTAARASPETSIPAIWSSFIQNAKSYMKLLRRRSRAGRFYRRSDPPSSSALPHRNHRLPSLAPEASTSGEEGTQRKVWLTDGDGGAKRCMIRGRIQSPHEPAPTC
jgi:hypothetical protein